MVITDKRRANISKILINVGSILFGTLVVANFTGTFNLTRFVVGVAAGVACFGGAIWIEK